MLYEVLQTKHLDILYCVKKNEETKCQLQNYGLNLFEILWSGINRKHFTKYLLIKYPIIN